MIIQFYAIYDQKSGAYSQPLAYRDNDVAVRAFSDLMHDPRHNYHLNPEDYAFFHIGEYDDNNANFDSFEPIVLARGHEIFDNDKLFQQSETLFRLTHGEPSAMYSEHNNLTEEETA